MSEKEDPKKSASEKEINPLDLLNENSATSSKVVANIVKNETAGFSESILGDAPEIDMSLLEDIAPPKNYLLVGLKWLSTGLCGLFLLSLFFFNYQLDSTFGFITNALDLKPTYKQLEKVNDQLIFAKTEENFYNFMALKADLDKFSFLGDAFGHYFTVTQSQTASNNDKRDAEEKLTILRADLKETFGEIARFYAKNSYVNLVGVGEKEDVEVLFITKLKERLAAEVDRLEKDGNARQARNVKQLAEMVTNGQLKRLFLAADVEKLDDEKLNQFIKTVSAEVVNDFSAIQRVKEGRVRWSEVMNEIDARTVAVDTFHNEEFYDELGGIRYTSYDFNSGTRKLTLTGDTKRFDTTNFTLTADLIDELNRSEMFSDAEMRSFNKSGSLTDGYTSTLKLTLTLN